MNRRPKVMLWGGLVALLVLAVGIGILAAGNQDESGGVETAFAEIIGTPLPPFDGSDAGVGDVAPGISARTEADEARVVLAMDDGTVRLVEFFAHWCPHCQQELPRQAAWLAANELPNGVEIVTVSTSVDRGAGNYPPSAWFARERWPLPILLDSDDRALAEGYGLAGFPYFVLVDGSGRVIERGSGELTEEQFAALIERAGQAVGAVSPG